MVADVEVMFPFAFDNEACVYKRAWVHLEAVHLVGVGFIRHREGIFADSG
jgi:hypothetical protein